MITVERLPSSMAEALGTPGTWGECWWTARDICLSNPREFPEPLQRLADALDRWFEIACLFGRSPEIPPPSVPHDLVSKPF